MMDRRRHAPVGRPRAPLPPSRQRGLPNLYAARNRRPLPDIYTRELADGPPRGGFRWFFSTLLAATVGALAISVVVLGSMDSRDVTSKDGCRTIGCMLESERPPAVAPPPIEGLKWATPKADKLQVISGAAATRYVIHDRVKRPVGGRQSISHRPYARIVARLAAIPNRADLQIPPFNPVALYGAQDATGRAGLGAEGRSAGEIATRIVELLGGLLPNEDGQELENAEVLELITRAQEESELPGMRPSFRPEGSERLPPSTMTAPARPEPVAPNTTVIAKSFSEGDGATEDIDGRQVKRLKSQRGDTPARLLAKAGADPSVVKAMLEAGKSLLPDSELALGSEATVVLVPSIARGGRLEPISLVITNPDGTHQATIARSAAGELIASEVPLDESVTAPPQIETEQHLSASLYASIYRAGLLQGLAPDTIAQVLRVFASDTDFRRRVRPTDSLEVFFDLKGDDRGTILHASELLFVGLLSSGAGPRFWRFRTVDGVTDYYDESGNNSRRFLIRRPIRADDARLTSGYGLRWHPLLGSRRMHTGVDWAAPLGTPILASGSGVVEEAKWKGEYGNYIRIRHGNGYQTAYGHMSRFAANMRDGVRVTQGQVIGFVGSTGQSSGPHLHYEVLINSQHTDPLSLQVPRERRLIGKDLAEFQKERARIDDLIRRRPVRVEQMDSGR